MSIAVDRAAGTRLEAYLFAHIPLLRSMQLRVEDWSAAGLTLAAPLAANVNHEGTAFGGSLESLAVLACWGMVWLQLEAQPDTHIVVTESHTRFLHPVHGALHAHCAMPQDRDLQAFLDTLHHHGKARIKLQSQIVENGALCVSFEGQFVARRAKPHAG